MSAGEPHHNETTNPGPNRDQRKRRFIVDTLAVRAERSPGHLTVRPLTLVPPGEGDVWWEASEPASATGADASLEWPDAPLHPPWATPWVPGHEKRWGKP